MTSAPTPPTATRDAATWGLALRIVVLAVAVVALVWLAVMVRQILLLLLFSVIIANGLRPLVERLQRRGLPRGASVLLIYLVLVGLLVALGLAVIPPVVREIDQAVQHAPETGERLSQWLRDLQARFPFLPPLDEQLIAQARNLGQQFGALASQALAVARFALTLFSGLLSTVLVLLMTLYLVVDGERIRDYFISFLRPESRDRARQVSERIGLRMGGWLLGQITLSVVIGLVSYAGLALLGVPGAALLAVAAGIGEAIPIVGPIAAAVPAVIVAATISPFHAGATLALYVMIQQLENNLLVPKIMERAVNLHPLAVVLSLLVGGELLGVLGTVVAVPTAAAIAVVLDEVRRSRAGNGPAGAGNAQAESRASAPRASREPAPASGAGNLPDPPRHPPPAPGPEERQP